MPYVRRPGRCAYPYPRYVPPPNAIGAFYGYPYAGYYSPYYPYFLYPSYFAPVYNFIDPTGNPYSLVGVNGVYEL